MKGRLQLPMYTAAALVAANPLLLEGEVVYESDTRKKKVGDGVNKWNDLAYDAGGGDNINTTPLGSIAWLLVDIAPEGYEPLWDGHTITRAQYPDFFAKLVDTNKLPTLTSASYDSRVASYGSCASFVKVNSDTVRLPRLLTYMRAGGVLGNEYNDQIVNITGVLGNALMDSASGSGAFRTSTDTSGAGGGQGANLYKKKATFDASNVVRTGSEVQPKSFSARPFLKCADVSRPLTEEQTSEIKAQIANKANSDLSNVTLAKLLSTSGYYKAPDGLLIQWGYATTNSATPTVYFPTSFYVTPFIVIGSIKYSASNPPKTFSVSTTGMYTSYATFLKNFSTEGDTNSAVSEPFYWIAIGRWK